VPVAATAAAARPWVPEPSTSDQLREESALLVRTRDALNASDAARALELIQDSRERFAGARLAQERDALEVQALVIAGESEQAMARARMFLTRYPDSPHAEKIRAIVGLH
jgi:outer membrane protein assembly factor BamD (BamD/ComL family)